MVRLLGYFAAAFAASAALTPLFRALARRLGYIARPVADRWHTRPTALLGGIAFILPVAGLAFTIRPAGNLWQVVLCGVLIGGFGLVDDLMSLKPSTKLIAQIICASLLLFFGYRLQWTESMVGDAMLTLVWIIVITNAMNLLDNMDGLSGGIAAIGAFFILCSIVAASGVTPHALYIAALIGSISGFLIYNVYPASIFMGDAGSLFLGFNLATLTLMVRRDGGGPSSVLAVMAAPVLLLLIPIFDSGLVTVWRLLSKRAPSQGGRDHTSHRLVAVGLSERTAVGILWALAMLAGAIGLGLQRHDPTWAIIAAVTFVIAMAIFAVYLSRVRVYADSDLALVRRENLTPLVVNLMYKRRIAEILLDFCLIPLAYYASYQLRFEGTELTTNYPMFIQSLPVVLAVQLFALFAVGGYRGVWRYFGMMDAVVFAKGVIYGTVGAVLVILSLYRFESYSRAVFVIYAALLVLLLCGSRASFRLVAEFVNRRRAGGRRCIVYGTSGAGLGTIREAFGVEMPVKVLGFIDDDPAQIRSRVQGYTVLGDFAFLLRLVAEHSVDAVVLNTRLIEVDRLRTLEQACQEHRVELLRLHIDLKRASAS